MALARLRDIPAVERVTAWYGRLERRDQLVVLSLGGLVSAVVIVFGIWQPLSDYSSSGQVDWERNRELVQYMRGTEKQARAIAGTSQVRQRSGQTLLTLVSRSARTEGIKANKLQPEGTDTVSVWFDSVSFNDLIRWLEKLAAEHDVQVHQISVNRGSQDGLVNVRLVLRG